MKPGAGANVEQSASLAWPPPRSVLGTEFSQPVRVAGGGGGLLAALNPFAHEVRVTRPMLQALEEKAAAAKQ